MKRLIPILFCLFILFHSTRPVYAQQKKQVADTINTDRPDQTESPHIVPAGHLQIETGLSINPFDSAGEKTPLMGMAVLRYGLSKKLELRLLIEEGRDRDRYLDETTQGLFPLAIGGKALLLERASGPIPQIALLAWLSLPFLARSSEQSIYWSPQVLMAFENKIGDKLELEYNIGAKQEVFGPRWQAVGSTSLHIELSKKLTGFVEYFGQYQPSEDPMHNIDGGLLYKINPKLQLDISGGRSVSAPFDKSSSFLSLGAALLL
jgi:hypothetical protein